VIAVDLQGSVALVTGGTRGLGKAIGMELARAGARVFLTHRWGSVPEDEICREFREEGLPEPLVIESDASDPEATRELMRTVKDRAQTLEIVVSNVAFAKVVDDLADLKRAAFELSLRYSTWPLVDLVQAASEVLGRFPRYVLAISSDGGEVFHPRYDLAGASKAALEALCRYLAVRLRPHGVRVNAVRPGLIETDSLKATLGPDLLEQLRQRAPDSLLEPRGVARACVALCSGLMDSVSGHVLVVDEAWGLVGPVSHAAGPPAGFPPAER
jgi:NAD(P)-dependent dehydrogenase (short-subunit alcohol dehydrogenase family)